MISRTHRRLASLIAFVALAASLAVAPAACKTAPSAQTALDVTLRVADVLCIIANAELDTPAIQRTCALLAVAEPAIGKIADAELLRRRAEKRCACPPCATDAAAP